MPPLERDTRDIVDHLVHIALFYIPTQFFKCLGCFKTIMQLLDSDWPANILAGLNFRAQENRLMSPDSVCAISAGPVGHETTSERVWSTANTILFCKIDRFCRVLIATNQV